MSETDAIRSRLAAIDREITSTKDRAHVFMKDCVRDGDYVGERYVRSQMLRRVDELSRLRAELRQELPPFTTEKDGIYYRHPVTPENKHLLFEALSSPPSKKEGKR